MKKLKLHSIHSVLALNRMCSELKAHTMMC